MVQSGQGVLRCSSRTELEVHVETQRVVVRKTLADRIQVDPGGTECGSVILVHVEEKAVRAAVGRRGKRIGGVIKSEHRREVFDAVVGSKTQDPVVLRIRRVESF